MALFFAIPVFFAAIVVLGNALKRGDYRARSFTPMGFPRSLRCEFCGKIADADPASPDGARPPRCPACEVLAGPLFTLGGAYTDVREVMINQHPGEPARKQLELSSHTVVVFLNARFEILGLEIETKNDHRLLRWSPAAGPEEFRVRNIGRSYDNRDELIKESDFDRTHLKHDIAAVRHVLQPDILAALTAAARG